MWPPQVPTPYPRLSLRLAATVTADMYDDHAEVVVAAARSDRLGVPWGKVIQGAVLCYVLAALLLHFLQPDLSPLALPMSIYVLGRGGFLMTLTFFALAIALLAAGSALRLRLPKTWARHFGVFFMVLAALATIVAGIFPDDGRPPPLLPATSTGWVHLFAGMAAFPSFLLGPLFLTLALRRQEEWRPDAPALAGVVVLLALSVIAFVVVAAPRDLAGLAQRVLLVLLFAWLLLVARRLVELRSVEISGRG